MIYWRSGDDDSPGFERGKTQMIRLFLALTLGFITAVGSASAQTDSAFSEKVHDFGVVPKGPVLKHYFFFTNNTGQAMQIAGVRVSCGCTSASATQNTIPAGGNAAIYAAMDTRRFLGDKTVTIYVTFVQPRYEEVALQVKAHSRTDFQIVPDGLDFGQVESGHAAKATVTVTIFGNPNWQLKEATASSKFLTPTVKVAGNNQIQTDYEVSAELRADVPVGKWVAEVVVTTNHPEVPQIRIPVSMHVTAALTAQPSSVSWNNAKVGEKATQEVVIRAAKPFRVLRVEGAQGQLSIEGITDEYKESHVLTLGYTATSPGRYEGELKVVTDLEEMPELSIPALLVAQ